MSLKIRDENGHLENVVDEKFYGIVVPTFLVHGGDGYKMIPLNLRHRQTGMFDVEIMKAHVERMSPIDAKEDGRLSVVE